MNAYSIDLREKIVAAHKPDLKLSEITFLPVIPRPEKIVCAVRNYMDHHNEAVAFGMKREITEFPPIFLRVWRSQVAHNAPVIRPKVAETTALGAAYAAGLATGFWGNLEDLRQNWAMDKTWEPRMSSEARDGLMTQWRKAVTRTFDWA